MRTIIIWLFSLFILFSGSVYAQQSIDKGHNNYNVVPLFFESWYPSVIITIQGVKIPLQLDLGTAQKIGLTLNPELIKKFNIKADYTGKSHQVSDAQGRKAIVKEFILPKIQIGNLTINNIKGYETHPFPWGTPGEAPKIAKNGVIGLGLISKFNSIIDYQNRKLILIEGNSLPPDYDVSSWTKIPFILNGNIITQLTNGDNKINLLWDTGAPINLIKSNVKLSGEMRNCTKKAIDQLAISQNNCKGIMATFTNGNQYLKNIMFYPYPLNGLPADGVIGEPVFKNHVVYINFSKQILSISN